MKMNAPHPFYRAGSLSFCAAALTLIEIAAAGESNSTEFRMYKEPQQLVEVEPGRKLNLVCMGEGSPTVVFDIGVGDPAGDWALVQPQVAKLTRTCSYDRSGLGFSDAGNGSGSSVEIVADLKRLLAAASISPPYLLVGQSYGAMNMRLYYYLHPEEVLGLVLVEPAHEDQSEGFRMLSPRALSRDDWAALDQSARLDRERCIAAARRKVDPNSDAFKGCVVDAPEHLPDALKDMYVRMQYGEKFQRAQGAEERAVFADSAEQLRAKRRGFGDLPVIVLSRSAEDRPLRDWETEHLRQARYQMWLDLHRAMADASSRGEQRIVPNSDHMLMLSQPDAVVTAVRDALALAAERVVSDPVYTAASVLVDVGAGRKLNLHCTGTGTPVVVFESGLGDGTKAWGLVQPEIAKHTTACSYDRAGLGFSDAANRPGTSANAVRDLQTLLKRAKLASPYVLVGHSYGGMNAKLFAATYPSSVAGLVLVDPSHEDMGPALFELDPQYHVKNKKYLSDLKRCLSADQPQLIADSELNALCVSQASPRYSEQINALERIRAAAPSRAAAWISEMTLIWTTSAAQVRNAKRAFGDMPLLLLSKPPSQPAPGESVELRMQKNLVLSKQREQTLARSTCGRQIQVRDCGHYIQLDQPKAVIDAILEVVGESGAKASVGAR